MASRVPTNLLFSYMKSFSGTYKNWSSKSGTCILSFSCWTSEPMGSLSPRRYCASFMRVTNSLCCFHQEVLVSTFASFFGGCSYYAASSLILFYIKYINKTIFNRWRNRSYTRTFPNLAPLSALFSTLAFATFLPGLSHGWWAAMRKKRRKKSRGSWKWKLSRAEGKIWGRRTGKRSRKPQQRRVVDPHRLIMRSRKRISDSIS